MHNDDASNYDVEICRVCRSEGTLQEPLFHPCLCSGSIKFIHESCLVEWLKHSRKKVCELCKHPFTFSPVYNQNMPERLPVGVFAKGMVLKVCKKILTLLRSILVASVWSLIPFTASFLFRVYLQWNWMSEVFAADEAPLFLLGFLELLDGLIITLGVVVLVLGAVLFRDYSQSRAVLGQVRVQPEITTPITQTVLIEDEADEEIHPTSSSEEDEEEEETASMIDDVSIASSRLSHISQNSRMQILAARRLQRIRQRLARDEINQLAEGMRLDQQDRDDVVTRVLERQRRTPSPRPILLQDELQTPLPTAPTNQDPLNFLNFLDGQGDGISMGEFLGFSGSIIGMLGRAFMILCGFTFLLHVIVFIPYFMGERTIELALELRKNLSVLSIKSFEFPFSFDADVMKTLYSLYAVAEMMAIRLKVFIIMAIGYIGISITDVTFLSLLDRFHLRNVSRIRRPLKFLFQFFKLMSFLAVELIAFPWVCGWIIDCSTLHLFEHSSLQSRLLFTAHSPMTSYLVHWAMGSIFMFFFASFVGILRDVLRPGLLHFIRNPKDSNYHPVQEIVENSIFSQGRKIVISGFIYGIVISFLFRFGSQIIINIIGALTGDDNGVFKVRINFSDPLSELPLDLILFNHLLIPILIKYVSLKPFMKRVIEKWTKFSAQILGIKCYFFGHFNAAHIDDHSNGRFVFVPNFDRLYQKEELRAAFNRPVTDSDLEEVSKKTDPMESRFTIVFRPKYLKMRVIGFLLLLWAFSVSCIAVTILSPIYVGRIILRLFIERPLHEMYSICTGFLVLWTTFKLVSYLYQALSSSEGFVGAMKNLFSSLTIFCKAIYFGLIVAILWPFLIGNFSYMLLLPFIVEPNQTPIFLIFINWAHGILISRLLFFFIDKYDFGGYKQVIDGIVRSGLRNANMIEVHKSLVIPITLLLLSVMFVPLLGTLCVMSSLGYEMQVILAVQKWVPLTSVTVPLLFLSVMIAMRSLNALAKGIRDDMYLIGRRLHNLER